VNILHTVPAYYPFQEKGGPVVKVRALVRGLVQRGHHVTVLTPDLGLSKQAGSNLRAQSCEWGHRLELDGAEVVYLATIGSYRALTLNPRVIGFCKSALSRFDIVHFYGLYDLLGPAVSSSCREQGIPYVVEPMGMYRPIDRSFRRKRLWHQTLGKAFLQRAALIVTTSELEQQEIVESGTPAEKIVIRYNGIDTGLHLALPARNTFREKWNLPCDEPLILFLSRLIPRKGADLLIEAFAEACPNSGRLVIAGPEGEPGYRAYLETRAKHSSVESRVLFTGPLYDEDKKTVFMDADLFVLPSRYENFANAAAEAMAFGVPVIIGESCGIRSLVEGHAGFVIPPTKEAIIQALQTLLHDKPLYARFQEECRRVAAKLDWSHLTGQMEYYYQEVLARNPRSAKPVDVVS
jgi:glycosyltransferase involved in cell wall biosynthesis